MIILAGLVRVQTDGSWTKYGQPGPLLDGAVASADSIGDLLRLTISNLVRRKMVEYDK